MSSDNSVNRKRSVSFDEELNQITEFDPVPPEDKAKVWLSKVQIRENRIQVAEELMMEKTKELVKAKLMEERILPTDQPAELLLVVTKMQQELEEIMSRSKPEILAFLQTKYNWITDCTDFWRDLPEHVQQAASTLGYTPELWDEFSQKLDVFEKQWSALTPEEQAAAKVLGYNEVTWNGSLEVDGPATTLILDDEPNHSSVVEMEQGEEDTAEPMYDWGEASDDSSPSDYDGDEEKMSDSDDSHDEKDSVSSSTDEEATPLTPRTTAQEIASRTTDTAYKGSNLPANVIEPMDDDEDEFIANFLLDDTAQPHSNKEHRTSLHDRYVPSDDEFDLEAVDLELGDLPPPSTENAKMLENKAAPSTQTVASLLSRDQGEPRSEETSPLLGQKASVTPTVGGGGGLFRRMLGSSTSKNSDRSCSSALKQQHEDDNDSAIGRSRNYHPFLSKTHKIILLFLLALTLVWLLTNHSVLWNWNNKKD